MVTRLILYLSLICFTQVSCDGSTKYELRGRNISAIGENDFTNNFNLKDLNLSSNNIKYIPFIAFTSLVNLQYLDLSRNLLTDLYFESYTLKKLKTLRASNNKIGTLQSLVFSNLKSLEYLDLSHNAIRMIEDDLFTNSASIKHIDLSNNLIKTFDVDMSNILKVKHIDLSNNMLTLKTGSEFSNLPALQVLYLYNNDIRALHDKSFDKSRAIEVLDISSNPNLTIINRPLQNLKLRELSINNIKSNVAFFFLLNSNLFIDKLNAHGCARDNLQFTHYGGLEKVRTMNLSFNEITAIDEHSFKNLHSLSSLDLSYNKITYIQPGSFMNQNNLSNIFLQGNQLTKLQFGVFSGIKRLVELNLSNNSLYTLDVQLLPPISKLILNDNKFQMTRLNIEYFFNIANLAELSIGTNQILCKDLIELKKLPKFKRIVKTPKTNNFIENVDGISCTSIDSEKYKIDMVSENNNSFSITNYCSKALEDLEKKYESEMKEVKGELKEIGKLLKTTSIPTRQPYHYTPL